MTDPTDNLPPIASECVLAVRPIVTFRPAEDSCAVEIGPRRQVLRGESATTLLPVVIDALETKRSVGAVAHDLEVGHGVAPEVTRSCLGRLFAWGLLEKRRERDGGEPPLSPAQEAQVGFLSQWTSHGPRVQSEIASTRVAVAGDAPGAEQTRTLLSHAGFRVESGADASGARLCIVWNASLKDAAHRALHRAALREGRPLLAVEHTADYGALGPLVLPGRSACLACARAQLGFPRATSMAATRSCDGIAMAALAAIEALRFAATPLRPACVAAQVQICFDTLECARVEIPRRPRCPECGVLTHRSPVSSFRGMMGSAGV